jgi:hypothetical protein
VNRSFVMKVGIAALLSLTAVGQAAPDLTAWFRQATAQTNGDGTYTTMAEPDFLNGTAFEATCSFGKLLSSKARLSLPRLANFWTLLSYDRQHHIARAEAYEDQCSGALFAAPAPAVNVPDADLSSAGTVRGLHVGSTYEEVIAKYGPNPAPQTSRFAMRYTATVNAHAVVPPYEPRKIHEHVTIAITDNRVTSIVIEINESGLT